MNTGVGSLSLLQEIFPTQELNWGSEDPYFLLALWFPDKEENALLSAAPVLTFPDFSRVKAIYSGNLLAQTVKNLPAMQETWV